jgi:hypothetical protein
VQCQQPNLLYRRKIFRAYHQDKKLVGVCAPRNKHHPTTKAVPDMKSPIILFVLAATFLVSAGADSAGASINTHSKTNLTPHGSRAMPLAGHTWGPYQKGYGDAKPSTIFNGNDPTGEVTHIHWTNWGAQKAIGTGIGFYVPASVSVVEGHTAPVKVVVWNLGICHGKRAYRNIEWYFPQYGESFDPHTYIDMCSGRYVLPERSSTGKKKSVTGEKGKKHMH